MSNCDQSLSHVVTKDLETPVCILKHQRWIVLHAYSCQTIQLQKWSTHTWSRSRWMYKRCEAPVFESGPSVANVQKSEAKNNSLLIDSTFPGWGLSEQSISAQRNPAISSIQTLLWNRWKNKLSPGGGDASIGNDGKRRRLRKCFWTEKFLFFFGCRLTKHLLEKENMS